MGKKILVIGGVALGPKAAARARRRDPEAEITIVDTGDVFSYAGCGMPFYIEGQITDIDELLCTNQGVRRDEAYFKSVKDIKLLGRTEALKINRLEKTVTALDIRTGRFQDIPYDKLVLGVGASPVMPPIEGISLEGVFRLYSPGDAVAIRAKIDEGAKRVVIVGGGLIGMEVCGSFTSRGCAVTVLEMMDRLIPALLDPDMSLLLEKYLRESGITLGLGCRASRIIDDGSGRASVVETANGDRFDADMVVVAIGVRPNVRLAKEAGLKIGVTGAIAVDEYLRTSDPDIYAGGDCVENIDLVTGRKVYLPLGSTANKHGRVIGDNVTCGETRFPGVTLTAVFKVLDFNVGKTGLSEREARELGFDAVTATAPRTDCSDYYPKNKPFIVKLIADRRSQKLLGCQALGTGEVVKRIDVVSTCLRFGAAINDLADLDLGYAPPYSTAIDAVAHAANVLRNKIQGLAHGISATELKGKMAGDDDFVLLDVRSRQEVDVRPFNDRRVVNIPIEELRSRLNELPRKEVVIFCKTSVRAYDAERILRGVGFNDVKFLDGSLTAWPYTY
jgi:NADPH-dependent 2,4-dienoyl-CoA reductase/sulfur reductase-like enzyme/rhodanese-related sulfurtransferase